MLSPLLVSRSRRMLALLLVLLALLPDLALAQAPPDVSGPKPFSAEELDQIAAPIALYPDPLVAQILMASTYPLEVVQAARFVKANPALTGDKLDAALKNETWDDSVKSLVSFPQVLTMMNDKLDWMQKLGDAFLGQQKEVMDAVQRLRAKAQAAGNLQSTPQQTVTVEPAPAPQVVVQQAPPTIITIQPANPQVIYVPTYNPMVVYGAWPYPAYPPYYYYPPGYVAGAALLSFGIGMAVGASLWGGCNWGRGEVNVNVNQYNSYTRNVNNTNIANNRAQLQNNRASGGQGQWQHQPEHRKGAQYRDTATQQRFNKAGAPNAQSREAYRGRAEQGRQELGRGGAQQGTSAARQGAGPQGGAQQRSQVGAAGSGASRGGAFEGVGQGRQTAQFSDRGSASRATMGAAGGARPSSIQAGGGQRGGAQAGGGQRPAPSGGGGAKGGGGRGKR